jgi:dienelactone hydrolase
MLSLLVIAFLARALWADGPADNVPEEVRPIPPFGVMVISAADREALENDAAALGKEIEHLPGALKKRPDLQELLPDVQVYHNAVRYALKHGEIYDLKEVATARALLERGRERAKQLRDGQAPWTTATGLVVRGYVSKIDGSVQPYGLVVPASYRPDTCSRHRLDLWCHGRGEMLTELAFIDQRQRAPGEFVAPNAFVLHLYGRYCNANKFAGEIDCLEALAHVRKHYPIDEDRLVMRGFSMGGAACWQFAVHYPSLWAAAAPGAGFSETADFLKVFQDEKVKPTWYEQKLWHMYDCTDYAGNLYNCPTVAYSGEKDRQKQAADMMEAAMAKEGLTLLHIIGPNTMHSYHPDSKRQINERIDRIAARGRNSVPSEVRFTTYTLRYHECFWVDVQGLEKHWERADVRADLESPALCNVRITTKNVTALTLKMRPGEYPLTEVTRPHVVIDGTDLAAAPVLSDRSWTAHFRKTDGKWQRVASLDTSTLAKRPGLQGPIDDAFMDSFLMVRPTGKAREEKVGTWAAQELKHALSHWRSQFRGEARVKDDSDVTEADITDHNLILWGDPASNKVLARIADRLPIRWNSSEVRVGPATFSAAEHVPVLIYPNPLNPKRYVVLNSGFTYREYDYLNNARQVPKLPDWAVVDVRTPPSSRWPGKVVAAGFFDESWRLTPKTDK